MPYDSVYSEKRPPGTLRTAWRNFYGDATAMIGLYGCAGLAILCIFGGWFAPYGIDQQFLGYQLLPPSWYIASGLVTEITRALSMAILDIAALGFLDLGAQLPSPEWGAMLGDALELIYVAPWTVMLPGAAIMISVLLVNLLGDGIRRAIIAGVE
ncbi:hypothetical protein JGY86_15015 [Raoultella sp. XY-1]|uniref:hypothetical protein n=1 Tax=Raoultella sp. XY-1 TaxID=2799495 RepID=UPI0019050EDD|nr:hypothetical protein [Raoultella sp. XY-1]QQN41640.1 hypothetical protein JGY86_15015 [Raoultella sp. XY-1]